MSIYGTFIGLATIDNQFLLDDYPEPNTKNKSGNYAIASGGPAANASVAFAVLGGKSSFITVLGKNHFSDFIKDDLKEQGVKITDVIDGEENLPVIATIITTKNGDRTVFTHVPENNHHFHALKQNSIQSDIILTDGFYINLALDVIYKSGGSGSVILDGGSWKPGLEKLLPFIDIAICSDDFMPPGCESKKHVIEFLQQSGIHKTAITRGHLPVIYYDEGGMNELEVPFVEAVDTLGAGDFFHGAFSFYYAQTKNFVHSLKEAIHFAAETCKYFGTRNWINSTFPFYNR